MNTTNQSTKIVALTDESYANFILDIFSYVGNETDPEAMAGYLKDLGQMSGTKGEKRWELLLNSGVFHDAIGKVLNYCPGSFVFYATEY